MSLLERIEATLESHLVDAHSAFSALSDRLDALTKRVAELEHGKAITETEFRLAAQERFSLACRLEAQAEMLVKIAEAMKQGAQEEMT